jgi:hypothetical protein
LHRAAEHTGSLTIFSKLDKRYKVLKPVFYLRTVNAVYGVWEYTAIYNILGDITPYVLAEIQVDV